MPLQLPTDKVIITVAQTGALVNKSMNPNVPEQPDEIVASSYACYNEGAAIVHIHARDKSGENTSNPEIFREIRDGIRQKCDAIIQFSTGGGPNLTQEQRIECLKATPEMASLNMGSMMRISGRYAGIPWSNMPHEIEAYVSRMRELGVKPEMEVYDLAMFREVNAVIEKGLVDKPYYINLVMGMRYQGACDATPKMLMLLHDFLPADAIFQLHARRNGPASPDDHGHDSGRLRQGGAGRQSLLPQRGAGHECAAGGADGANRQGAGEGTGHSGGGQSDSGAEAPEPLLKEEIDQQEPQTKEVYHGEANNEGDALVGDHYGL